jgi:Na+-transporting NADH:ubiquinone oxidoreductase subunit NqrC
LLESMCRRHPSMWRRSHRSMLGRTIIVIILVTVVAGVMLAGAAGNAPLRRCVESPQRPFDSEVASPISRIATGQGGHVTSFNGLILRAKKDRVAGSVTQKGSFLIDSRNALIEQQGEASSRNEDAQEDNRFAHRLIPESASSRLSSLLECAVSKARTESTNVGIFASMLRAGTAG